MAVQFLDGVGNPVAGFDVTITPGPITGTTDATGSIPATLRSDTLYTATFSGAGAPTQTPSFWGNTTGSHALDDSGDTLTDDNADALQFDVTTGTIVTIAGDVPVYTIIVEPANLTFALANGPVQYVAWLYENGAQVRDVTDEAIWNCSPLRGSVDSTGLFTPTAPGFGTISATYDPTSGPPVTSG